MSKWQQNGKEALPILALICIVVLAIGVLVTFGSVAIHEVFVRFPYPNP